MIPIVEFAPFLTGDQAAQQQVADAIASACQKVGFFYLRHPGVSPQSTERLFRQSQMFFDLPLARKSQVRRSPETNCGYVPLGSEKLDPTRPGDWKEAFNVGCQTPWPDKFEPFQQEVWGFYQQSISQIAQPLLHAFGLALSLPADFLTQRHQRNFILRLLHYPPLAPTEPLRAGAHTDYGSFTLLWQDGTGGLEILSQQGHWLPVTPQPGLILVNIGDAMQRWTNDRFRSTPHRVVCSAAASPRSRYSAALFCDPDLDVEIAGLPSCQNADSLTPYPPIRYRDYLNHKFALTY